MDGSLVNQGKSWLLPGATEADLKVFINALDLTNHYLDFNIIFKVASVKIIPHHEMAATKLQKQETIILMFCSLSQL